MDSNDDVYHCLNDGIQYGTQYGTQHGTRPKATIKQSIYSSFGERRYLERAKQSERGRI
jgi:hypothetical protein